MGRSYLRGINKEMKILSYDTETTGFERHGEDTMFAFSTCNWDGKTDVQRLDGSAVRKVKGGKKLLKLWNDSRTVKVMHNAKFDLGFTEKALGMQLHSERFHDTYIQSHILQSHHPNHK